jgi:hypothetical protein
MAVAVTSKEFNGQSGVAPRLIRCGACGTRCPEGLPSCPNCGMPIRRESTYRAARRAWRRSHSGFVADDVEDEVRDKLYGGRTGCVRLKTSG